MLQPKSQAYLPVRSLTFFAESGDGLLKVLRPHEVNGQAALNLQAAVSSTETLACAISSLSARTATGGLLRILIDNA